MTNYKQSTKLRKHKAQTIHGFVFWKLCFVFCLGFAFWVWFIPAAFAQISGLEFLNISPDAKIGDVIAALYIYGVGFVALAALIVFTAGGVKYIFAGDKDPSEAKSWMKNAFWGLVLALTSWLILYTINPALVKNVGDLKLPTISITPGSEGAKCVVGSTNPAEQCTDVLRCINGKCSATKLTSVQCLSLSEDKCETSGCTWGKIPDCASCPKRCWQP